MIFDAGETPLFSTITLSQTAEKELVTVLLEERFLSDPVLHRQLASYPFTDEMEKDKIILDLMKILWERHSLHPLFMVFRDFDTFFSAFSKRGHFIHQFEVFLLGWYLIRRLLELGAVSTMISKFGEVREVFSGWLITSTAHDFGYPIGVTSQVIAELADLYKKLGAHKLSSKYRSIKNECVATAQDDLTDLESPISIGKGKSVAIRRFIADAIGETLGIGHSSAEELLRMLERSNHGYISAVLLCNAYLKSLSGLGSQRVSRELERLKLASAAIALHAVPQKLENEIQKMAFCRNPYAYILFMVDNLQDWSRDLRPNERYPSYNLLAIKLAKADGEVRIRYVLTHSKWTNKIETLLVKSLFEKNRKLKLLPAPSPPVNFRVRVNFATNHGLPIKDTILKL